MNHLQFKCSLSVNALHIWLNLVAGRNCNSRIILYVTLYVSHSPTTLEPPLQCWQTHLNASIIPAANLSLPSPLMLIELATRSTGDKHKRFPGTRCSGPEEKQILKGKGKSRFSLNNSSMVILPLQPTFNGLFPLSYSSEAELLKCSKWFHMENQ